MMSLIQTTSMIQRIEISKDLVSLKSKICYYLQCECCNAFT